MSKIDTMGGPDITDFQLATLNSVVGYPGVSSAGRIDNKVHLKLDLSFDNADDARLFLVRNQLPTVAIDRRKDDDRTPKQKRTRSRN